VLTHNAPDDFKIPSKLFEVPSHWYLTLPAPSAKTMLLARAAVPA
jgi:hypothetical protein